MTDRDYAIKSMKEITFQMASHAQDYLEVTIERHYTDIKELMTSYQKLILKTPVSDIIGVFVFVPGWKEVVIRTPPAEKL